MIYLATSPFISNIAISFIAVNLTVICFKRETERESIRLATDTFCSSHPSPHSTERAVSGAGGGGVSLQPPHQPSCLVGAKGLPTFRISLTPCSRRQPLASPLPAAARLLHKQGWTRLVSALARCRGYHRRSLRKRLQYRQPVPGKES